MVNFGTHFYDFTDRFMTKNYTWCRGKQDIGMANATCFDLDVYLILIERIRVVLNLFKDIGLVAGKDEYITSTT